jgi:hypothetical protein
MKRSEWLGLALAISLSYKLHGMSEDRWWWLINSIVNVNAAQQPVVF